MKRKFIFIALLILVSISASNARVTSASPEAAPRGTGYDLSWYTVDGGGAMYSTGGTYSLGGTIGQADAGTLNGGTYTLAGGFWNSGLGNLLKLYLPLIMR